jgi:hypothetical protein
MRVTIEEEDIVRGGSNDYETKIPRGCSGDGDER